MRHLSPANALAVAVKCFPFAAVIFSGAVHAQGLTGSEVSGIVRLADGRPLENAFVTLVSRSSGAERSMRTRSGGVYRFEAVDVGSYRLEARAIGSKAASTDSIELHLGDRLRVDIVLGVQTTVLDDAVVTAQRLRDPGAGGAAKTIAGRAARNIPLINRDFAGLLLLSSQSLGSQGLWISGQHARYNAIQIDGAAANDFFGVSVTPGSASGSRLISLEALEEVRILTSPFDVRMGGFAGGLINAVTRSGTNQRSYSMFASLTRAELFGIDTSGSHVPEFNQVQYGLAAGGPIIRDRLHYFLAAELQQRASRLTGQTASDPRTGVSEATVARMRNAIRDRYGFDPGSSAEPDIEAPSANILLKLSWHPRPNVSIDFTPSYASSRRDTLSRSINTIDGWQLSRSGAELFSNTGGAVLKASYNTGAVANETIAGFNRNRFGIRSKINTPAFLVEADVANVYAAAGSMRGAQGTRTFQSVAQLAHNSSLTLGDHTLIAGTQDFLVHVSDEFVSAAWGVWTFESIDSLEAGHPSKYEVALPARPGEPAADYRSLLASVYLEDQWQATPALRITAGLRGDAGFFPRPRRNSSLVTNDALGNIDTGAFPSGKWGLSPRVGFAWMLDNRGRLLLRGGVGSFTARPPYVWTTNAYASTGETQAFLTCTQKEGVPAVTAELASVPVSCAGSGGASSAVPLVSYFDPGFRFPQAIKGVVGVDAEVIDGWTASLDLTTTRTKNQTMVADRNLVRQSTNGEQRVMYGTISANGNAAPARISSNYSSVYRFGSYTADRSMSASASIRKEWSASKLIDLGYTWSRTMDVVALAGFNGTVIMRNNPLDGTFDSRRLRRSARDVPHNLVATAIFPAGAGFTGGLFFRARSGTPWAFTIRGDANADGATNNDLAYIPRDSSDISLRNPATFSALNNLIEGLGCARSQRGHIMKRNSCRNSPVTMLDGRIARSFAVRNVQRVEVSADVFNIPNLINHRWGIVRETSNREDVPLMTLSGWDDARSRPRYSIPTPANSAPTLPSIDKAVVDASRWRVQLSARYEF